MDERVKAEMERGDWEEYYRRYQSELARRFLLPTLEGWGVTIAGKRILEIGCGNGGCGAEFHRRGATVVMMDIDARLVGVAREGNEREGLDIVSYVGDVFDEDGDFYKRGPFDLIMLRDVIEHLDDPVRALSTMSRNLSESGAIFVVFPPYYSPYGAHQQILPRKTVGPLAYNKMPWIQLLPNACFARLASGEGPARDEVMRLREIRLTLGRFERALHAAGLRVERHRHYLSRPTFTLRYGVPTLPAGVVGRIPGLRELFVTAGYYLLRR